LPCLLQNQVERVTVCVIDRAGLNAFAGRESWFTRQAKRE